MSLFDAPTAVSSSVIIVGVAVSVFIALLMMILLWLLSLLL